MTGPAVPRPRDLPVFSHPPSCFVLADQSGSYFGQRWPSVTGGLSSCHLPVFGSDLCRARVGCCGGHVLHVDTLLFTYFALVRVGFAERVQHLEHDPRNRVGGIVCFGDGAEPRGSQGRANSRCSCRQWEADGGIR